MHRDPILLLKARRLRSEMTDAEKKLWFRIRGRQLDGYRFRRQVPIGSYIADFACLHARLVIELDGGQHGEPDIEARDARRTEWLQSRGYRVLRFWNHDVLTDTDSVTETIFNALQGEGNLPPPPP